MATQCVLVLCILAFATCSAVLRFPDYKTHPCKRDCVANQIMTCRYTLTLEWLFSMEKECGNCPSNATACNNKGCVVTDGKQRLINVFNRMLPGPQLEVCVNDEVIVDLVNDLEDVSTSIHWHGQHQIGTPYMDGVPFVTQCPVHPHTTFRYHFRATQSGTHFYHSHSGMQRANGAYGHLIVKAPNTINPHRPLYDNDLSDNVISFLDWTYDLPDVMFNTFYRAKTFQDNLISAILVNGIGSTNRTLPPPRFIIEGGKRHRFRFIHAGIELCPIEIKIDNHRMSVISSDGYDVKPIDVDTLYLTNGERYDVIITGNQSAASYWMKFKGLQNCINRDALAILQYKGQSNTATPLGSPTTPRPDGKKLNCINVPYGRANCTSVSQMQTLAPMNYRLMGTPDFKYYFGFDMYNFAKQVYTGVGDEILVTPAINNISFVSTSSPLLQNPNQQTCNFEQPLNCVNGKCECTHVVNIPLGSLVEIILVDEGRQTEDAHPMHLHGYGFRVVSQDKIADSITTRDIRALEAQGLLNRNLYNAPIKDTVPVPDGGYVIIRFVAANPGFWLFHCHIELHMEAGMGFVLKTGSSSDMPALPTNFPRCGNYLDETPVPPATNIII